MAMIPTPIAWENVATYFRMADAIDCDEGMVAYERYHMMMKRIANYYRFPLERVVAVFVSLSPNSDYWGNLRSTVSVLDGLNKHLRADQIVVSTYGHCKERAIAYARGHAEFERETKGPKIFSFYHNILRPHSEQFVTIDGHMVGVIRDDRASTMKELLISKREYEEYAWIIKEFARRNHMLPCQMQAILWFVRKRILNVRFDAQFDLFGDKTDAWQTARDVRTIRPYSKVEGQRMAAGNVVQTQWGLFDAQ